MATKPIPVSVVQQGFERSIRSGGKAAGEINIPVNAKFNPSSLNNLAQPLGRVTGLATEFEKSIAASNARVIAFGASVGIINGIQNAFAALVTTTIEVQKSLTAISVISNTSGKELEKFGDSLFEVAKNTGQSFKVASEAALEFSRQGLGVEETLKRTNDALTLTRFTSLSAAESVDVLTAAVNSFSSSGVTTTQILNKLVAVDSKFAVSAADLANGLSRAGAIAQEAGVSLDELNGIITSVQESTARGGAVIGNAFKTIFTRIRSEPTIKALEEIGVYSKTAEGNLKPVIAIFQELSSKLKDLSEVKRLQVLESIASQYNVNVLAALLGDINKAQGAFQQSTGTSAEATIEAYQRQLELNKALNVAVNNVFVSSEKLANSIGRIGVTDNLKGLLDFFGNLIDSVNDVVDSEGIGGNIARGLITGLGGVFFKIGIPVLTSLFVVLTKNIIQFGAESLQTILGVNSKVKERQALEQAVFNTLVQNKNIMAEMKRLSGSRVQQEEFLIDIYDRQLRKIQKVKDTAASVAPALQGIGFIATSSGVERKGKAAGGYLPAQEAADVSRGVGGASPSSKVVSIPNFAFGGGKKGTMIANTSEYIVPNYANGGSAIFNQDMIKSFGVPAGAKKLGAAGGYVPNFANEIGVAPKPAASGRSFEQRVRDYLNVFSTRGSNAIFDFYPGDLDKATQDKKNALGVKGSWGDLKLNFNEYARKSILAKLINGNQDTAPDKIIKATKANRQSISLNEASQIDGATLFYKAFDNNPKQGQSEVKQTLGTILKEGKQSPKLLSLFDEIRTDPGAEKKVGLLKNNAGKKMSSIMVRANLEENAIIDPESFQTGAASLGYIPNFADPLKAAVEREMAAGLDPSQIRITKDARLKNGKNPEGFAVINTRDEPDGKIPNFVNDKPILGSGMFGSNRQEGRAAQKELDSMKAQKKAAESSDIFANAQNVLIKEIILKQVAYKNGSIIEKELIDSTKSLAETYKLGADAQKKVITGSEDYISKTKAIANIEKQPFPSLEGVPVVKQTGNKKGGAAAKDFDFGKFLVLQSAVVGATSAVQVFTEENSKASAAIETASGAASLAVTAFSLPFKANPVIAAVTLLATGVSVLIPIISKWSSALETDGDRAVKSLASLANQARKTGETITPEMLLANLNKVSREKEETVKQKNITEQVKAYVKENPIVGEGVSRGLSDEQIESISAAVQGLGGVTKDETGNFKINAAVVKSLIEQGSVEKGRDPTERKRKPDYFSRLGNISNAGLPEKTFNNDKFADAVRADALVKAKANIGKIEERTGGTQEKAAQISLENELLQVQQNIANSIFNSNLLSNNTYAKNILAIEKQNALLERGKTIISEKQILELQGIEERKKADEEASKSSAENLNKLREKLTSLPGNTGGAFAKSTDAQLQALLEAGKTGTNSDKFRQAFLNAQDPEKDRVALDSSSQSKNIQEAVFASAQNQSSIDNDLNNQKKAIAQKYELSQTTLQKNIQETEYLNAIINGTSVTIKGVAGTFEGTEKYTELLNNQIGGYAKSLAELKLKNKLALSSIDERIDSELETSRSNLEYGNSSRILGDVVKIATTELNNYKDEIGKKIQQFKKDAINAQAKAEEDINLLNAEKEYIAALASLTEKVQDDQFLTSKTNAQDRKNIDAKTEARNAAKLFDLEIQESNNKLTIAQAVKSIDAAKRLEKANLDLATQQANLTVAYQDLEQQILNEPNRQGSVYLGKQQDVSSNLTNLRAIAQEGSVSTYADGSVKRGKAEAAIRGSIIDPRLTSATKDVEEFEKSYSGPEKDRDKAVLDFRQRRYDEVLDLSTKQNAAISGGKLIDEAKTFQQILGQDTPKALADGLAQAMQVGLSGADNIGEALEGIAKSFLQTLQTAFLQSASNKIVGSTLAAIGGSKGGYVRKFANGGMVTGGSGIRDDVPAMLSSGEYVMRKSAVQKYGAENIAKMNNGGIFLPGVRGGSAISGYDQLSKFANQTTTSGATDVLKGSGSAAFANLEDQSARLSRFGLMNEDTIKGEVTSAQQQGLDLISKREAYRTQQRKAMQQQIISTIASVALAYGASKLKTTKTKPEFDSLKLGSIGNVVAGDSNAARAQIEDFDRRYPKGVKNNAYGGMVRGFNNGGGPTDDIPALLMGGEYVMNRATTRKYGKQYLDSMNTGRARFADGGEVGMDATVESSDSKAKIDSKTGTAVNISINVSGSSSSTESQGQTSQGGVDYKKMGERIKAVVLETINEEKRLGGALRSR